MSPAAVIQKSQDQHLQSLARAFAALLITTQRLSCKEKELQQQVKYAHEEVCGIFKKNFFLFFFFFPLFEGGSSFIVSNDEIFFLISSRSGAALAAVTDKACIT